jgi:hypothetical protein
MSDVYPATDTRAPFASLRHAFPEVLCWKERLVGTAGSRDSWLEYRSGPWIIQIHDGGAMHVVYHRVGTCGNGNSKLSLADAKKEAFLSWKWEIRHDLSELVNEEAYLAGKLQRCRDSLADIDTARAQYAKDAEALYQESSSEQ